MELNSRVRWLIVAAVILLAIVLGRSCSGPSEIELASEKGCPNGTSLTRLAPEVYACSPKLGGMHLADSPSAYDDVHP